MEPLSPEKPNLDENVLPKGPETPLLPKEEIKPTDKGVESGSKTVEETPKVEEVPSPIVYGDTPDSSNVNQESDELPATEVSDTGGATEKAAEEKAPGVFDGLKKFFGWGQKKEGGAEEEK